MENVIIAFIILGLAAMVVRKLVEFIVFSFIGASIFAVGYLCYQGIIAAKELFNGSVFNSGHFFIFLLIILIAAVITVAFKNPNRYNQ